MASAADFLVEQMGELHLEEIRLQNYPCRDFKLKRDKDGRAMKIVDNTILVKKESEYIDNEMRIYAIIKDLPDIPKVLAVYTCTDDNETGDKLDKKYKVIQYELFVNHYEIRTHAEMMKYFREVFDSYMGLLHYNVIHNDLKPDNVLLNPKTNKYVVSDFDSSEHVVVLREYMHNINRDFHRFFELFSKKFKPTTLWNESLNQAMSDALQRLQDTQKTCTPDAFRAFFKQQKKEKKVDSVDEASDMFVHDYLKFIKEEIIDRFDKSAGHGGKNRRTIKSRRPSKSRRTIKSRRHRRTIKTRRHRRTNKTNKRRGLTE